ncbi:unnamed protein product [Wickerhamomyces anomalus]
MTDKLFKEFEARTPFSHILLNPELCSRVLHSYNDPKTFAKSHEYLTVKNPQGHHQYFNYHSRPIIKKHVSTLCPYCSPFKMIGYGPSLISKFQDGEEVLIDSCLPQFYDETSGEYEKHLAEEHGVYKDSCVNIPFVGLCVANFCHDYTPSIICPYEKKTFQKKTPCLTTFHFNVDTDYPFRDYFKHVYHHHIAKDVHVIDSDPVYRKEVELENNKLFQNVFYPFSVDNFEKSLKALRFACGNISLDPILLCEDYHKIKYVESFVQSANASPPCSPVDERKLFSTKKGIPIPGAAFLKSSANQSSSSSFESLKDDIPRQRRRASSLPSAFEMGDLANELNDIPQRGDNSSSSGDRDILEEETEDDESNHEGNSRSSLTSLFSRASTTENSSTSSHSESSNAPSDLAPYSTLSSSSSPTSPSDDFLSPVGIFEGDLTHEISAGEREEYEEVYTRGYPTVEQLQSGYMPQIDHWNADLGILSPIPEEDEISTEGEDDDSQKNASATSSDQSFKENKEQSETLLTDSEVRDALDEEIDIHQKRFIGILIRHSRLTGEPIDNLATEYIDSFFSRYPDLNLGNWKQISSPVTGDFEFDDDEQ